MALPAKRKDGLLVKLLWDLKEARERLKANSQTRSRLPRSDPLWHGAVSRKEDSKAAGNADSPEDPDADDEGTASAAKNTEPKSLATPAEADPPGGAAAGPTKKAGRQPGAAGHSRLVTLPINDTVIHASESCARCGEALDPAGFVAHGGRYVLDLDTDRNVELPGLRIRHDKPLYGEMACGQCGHVNRSEPGRCQAEPGWSVGLSEWHLVGPMLVSLLVCFSHRMHLSRRRTQEFLRDWLGVALSTSTSNHPPAKPGAFMM